METIPGNDAMNPPTPLAGLDPGELLRQGVAEDTVLNEDFPAFQAPSLEELAPWFPQFEILELIGRGGMGAVYKVRQKDLDRVVALKILPPAIGRSPAFADRFTREAKALAKLNHPGIVTLHEFGQTAGAPPLYFIVMEFVDGLNLAQLLRTSRISPREALAIVPQICDALQYAHDQGIVHRDIKPENILLDRKGRVKVADFGIAKVMAAVSDQALESGVNPGEATLAGKVMGTPQYMAPEQIEHPAEVDHRADIYALGVVFYQMLTGELPGKDLQAPSRKVQIEVRLDEIVLRAPEKSPQLRFQTAGEFRTRLEAMAEPLPAAGGASAAPGQSPPHWRQRVSLTRVIVGCMLFGLLMALREEFHGVWLRAAIAGLAAIVGFLGAASPGSHWGQSLRKVFAAKSPWHFLVLGGVIAVTVFGLLQKRHWARNGQWQPERIRMDSRSTGKTIASVRVTNIVRDGSVVIFDIVSAEGSRPHKLIIDYAGMAPVKLSPPKVKAPLTGLLVPTATATSHGVLSASSSAQAPGTFRFGCVLPDSDQAEMVLKQARELLAGKVLPSDVQPLFLLKRFTGKDAAGVDSWQWFQATLRVEPAPNPSGAAEVPR